MNYRSSHNYIYTLHIVPCCGKTIPTGIKTYYTPVVNKLNKQRIKL